MAQVDHDTLRRVRLDQDCDAWRVGDSIVWEDEFYEQFSKQQYYDHGIIKSRSIVEIPAKRIFTITRMWKEHGYLFWNDPDTGEENTTRHTNMYRASLEENNG